MQQKVIFIVFILSRLLLLCAFSDMPVEFIDLLHRLNECLNVFERNQTATQQQKAYKSQTACCSILLDLLLISCRQTCLHSNHILLLYLYNESVKEARSSYFNNLINHHKSNSRALFDTINSIVSPPTQHAV